MRRLVAIIGEAALSSEDRLHLEFADRFESQFLHQGAEARSMGETMDRAWELLSRVPEALLKRVQADYIHKYRKQVSHG